MTGHATLVAHAWQQLERNLWTPSFSSAPGPAAELEPAPGPLGRALAANLRRHCPDFSLADLYRAALLLRIKSASCIINELCSLRRQPYAILATLDSQLLLILSDAEPAGSIVPADALCAAQRAALASFGAISAQRGTPATVADPLGRPLAWMDDRAAFYEQALAKAVAGKRKMSWAWNRLHFAC